MPHAARDFSAALNVILGNLLPLIMQQVLVLRAYTLPLHARITRTRQRLTRLLALLAAGRLPRVHTPQSGKNGGPKPALYIPQKRAWLVVQIGYRAAGFGAQLENLLREPNTQALLAAAPPEAVKSLGRTLRPLCRLLGVDLPPELRRPAPAPKPPQPITSRPATSRRARPKPVPLPPLPPLLPLYPQRRPRPMPFLDVLRKNRP